MEIDVRIEKPEWDPNPQKSTTQNWEWRKCVIVCFPNQSFKWIPTYKQLVEIYAKLAECEVINRNLAKEMIK